MLRLAADENFNGDIVRGLLRRNPKLDIVRVQDGGLSGADDPSVLQWAADQGRILVTHDISTLAKHAIRSNRSRSADARGVRGKVRCPCRTGYRRFDSPVRVQLRWRMGGAGALPAPLRSSLRLQSQRPAVPVSRVVELVPTPNDASILELEEIVDRV